MSWKLFPLTPTCLLMMSLIFIRKKCEFQLPRRRTRDTCICSCSSNFNYRGFCFLGISSRSHENFESSLTPTTIIVCRLWNEKIVRRRRWWREFGEFSSIFQCKLTLSPHGWRCRNKSLNTHSTFIFRSKNINFDPRQSRARESLTFDLISRFYFLYIVLLLLCVDDGGRTDE